MGNISLLVFRYILTLSAISVMVLTRKKIGMNAFLPWEIKQANPVLRVILRLFMVSLIFVWVRIFFLIELRTSSDPSPFDATYNIWQQFIDRGFYFVLNVHTFFHYLSYTAAFAGLVHIVSVEIYYRTRKPITSGTLGSCFITGWMEGKKILGCKIDNYLIWGFIEPLTIVGIGFLAKYIIGSFVLFAFLFTAGVAMFLQGQLARLKHREMGQSIINSKKESESIGHLNKGFQEKSKPNGKADNHSQEASFL